MSISRVVEALQATETHTRGSFRASYRARCPCHDDQHPSLDIDVDGDGKVLLICRVCGSAALASILSASHLTMADLFPDPVQDMQPRGKIVATYDYHDENGNVLYQACRVEPGPDGKRKTFFQQRPARLKVDGSADGWIPGMAGVSRVLYRLPELQAADAENWVFVPEGEKKVDALRKLGCVATCNVGGAKKWLAVYSSMLRGRNVCVLPDNDDPGREHAATVKTALAGIAGEVVVVALPGLSPKGDVIDWLAGGGTVERLYELVVAEQAKPTPEANGKPSANGVYAEAKESWVPSVPKWPAFPREEAFHGLAGNIVRAIDPHTESDPVAILGQFLAAFGNVIGRSACMRVEASMHYGNIYVVLVGKTAKGRKGTSWNWVKGLFTEDVAPGWSENCIQGGLSSGEGLVWAVRDRITKREPVRATSGSDKGKVTGYQDVEVAQEVTDKRLLVVEEEFAQVLKQCSREGSILSVVLRQAWDTGQLRSMTKNNPGRATGAHVSIVSHVTQQELQKLLKETDAANGFANRFIWLAVRRSKLLPDGGGEPDLSELRQELAATITSARVSGPLERSEEAAELWRENYARIAGDRPGLFGAVTSRAEAQVLRLIVLYARLDRSCLINVEHVAAALALWDYAEKSCAWVFSDSTGDWIADVLLDGLLAVGETGLNLTEISNLFKRNRTAREIRSALALLEEHGLVIPGKRACRGQPAEKWKAKKPTCVVDD